MSLRRIDRLLNEIRYSTNTQDTDSITDKLLIYYSNRVQSMIEDALFVISGMNNIFMESYEIDLVDGTQAYDLPFDCYGVNALKSVGVKRETSAGFLIDPIAFISEKEAGSKVGYSLKENQIMLNFQNSVGYPINVNYVRKIPTIGKRFSTAATGLSTTTITVPVTASTELLTDYDDFFCIVDVDGVIIARNLRATGYVYSTGVITYSGGTFIDDYPTVSINPLAFTALVKTGWNAISIAYTNTGTAGSEVVTVTGSAISVAIQSGVSTANQVVTALRASTAAMALITVSDGTAATVTTTAAKAMGYDQLVGNYVVPGKYSTTHSQLPEECEKVFLEVAERRVAQRQSATDMNVISPLTDREIQLMTDVFAKGTDDNEVPPTPMYSEFI